MVMIDIMDLPYQPLPRPRGPLLGGLPPEIWHHIIRMVRPGKSKSIAKIAKLTSHRGDSAGLLLSKVCRALQLPDIPNRRSDTLRDSLS